MDANKLKVLQEINYTIHKACGWCAYFRAEAMRLFGTCEMHQYDHLKHSEATRDLSVYRYGVCNKFIAHPPAETFQGAFHQFVEG